MSGALSGKSNQAHPRYFLFDIHEVLLAAGPASPGKFKAYLLGNQKRDKRISLNWDGDIAKLMNGLLIAKCPLCNFEPCEAYTSGSPHIKKALYKGEISFSDMCEYIEEMLTRVDCDEPVRVILSYLNKFMTTPGDIAKSAEKIAPGLSVLQYLYNRYGSDNLFILSNANPELLEKYLETYPEIFGLFKPENIMLSAQFGLCKPDKDIFSLFLERYKLKGSDVLFFDDNPKNIAGAQDAGINGLLFDVSEDGLGALYRKLQAYNIEI